MKASKPIFRDSSRLILVSPLNWGLGHASRLIPIIRFLENEGHKVIIAAGQKSYELLKNECPNTKIIQFPSANIFYLPKPFFIIGIAFQIPKLIYFTILEKIRVKKIIKQKKINCIISDNRYGFRHPKIPSAIIIHQIHIRLSFPIRFLQAIIYKINNYLIGKFNCCFIPDFDKEDNLSGKLSHNDNFTPENCHYIGILSRFSELNKKAIKIIYDFLIILSGPEPHRTHLKKVLLKQFTNTSYKIAFLEGKPEQKNQQKTKNSTFFSHLNTVEMQKIIEQSKYIICRAGYSSIMDMVRLQKKAFLIPTPGQTEQEYLANYLYSQKIFYTQKQNELNIPKALKEMSQFNVSSKNTSNFEPIKFFVEKQKVPNLVTKKAIQEADKGNLKRHKTVKSLMRDLNN